MEEFELRESQCSPLKISQMKSACKLYKDDVFPIVQGGNNLHASMELLVETLKRLLDNPCVKPDPCFHSCPPDEGMIIEALNKAIEALENSKNALYAANKAYNKVLELSVDVANNHTDILEVKSDLCTISTSITNLESIVNELKDSSKISISYSTEGSNYIYKIYQDSILIGIISVPKVDSTLTQSGASADAKTVGDALNTKQGSLTAGVGISISNDNIISCTLDAGLFIVVTSLPTTGVSNKIYLLPSTTTGEENIYIEYLYVNNVWEKIGEYKASTDLSGYAKSVSVNSGTKVTPDTAGNINLTVESSVTKLNDLTDVSISNATTGDVLYYNGTTWANTNLETLVKSVISSEALWKVNSSSQLTPATSAVDITTSGKIYQGVS